MTTRRSPQQIVTNTLREEDSIEVERMLVCDALVVREGNHYRIESDGEPLPMGNSATIRRCDCGHPLSSCGHCRRCGRDYLDD